MLSTLSINAGLFALSALTLASLMVSFLAWKKKAAPTEAKQQRPARVVNLNMGIAGVHTFTSQLIGVQLAGANMLALALSVLSVVAGTVSVAVTFFPLAVPLWLIAGAVGAGLAVLIEGLTLGALIRIRLANRAIREASKQLDEQLSQRLNSIAQPVPGPDFKVYRAQVKMYRTAIKLTQEDHLRRMREVTGQHKRFASCVMAFFGALASACAGGIFYHTLFSQLAPWVSLPLSALFPLVVTGTFVSTELFRETQEQAIKEAFRGGALAEAAIQQETLRLTYQGIHEESVRFMETDEAKQMITAGFKDVLARSIQDMKAVDKPDTPSGQTHIHLEEDTGQQPRLLSASTRRHTTDNNRILDTKTEAAGATCDPKLDMALHYLAEHPDASDSELAAHMGLRRPASARFWRLKAESLFKGARPQSRDAQPRGVEPDTRDSNEGDTTARLEAYMAAHPQATQKEIAGAFGLSERTIRRHQSDMRKQQRTADTLQQEEGDEDNEEEEPDSEAPDTAEGGHLHVVR